MKKRFFSILLALALCLTLLPGAAFAAEDTDDTGGAAAVQSTPQTQTAGSGTALMQKDISNYKHKSGGQYSENGVYLPAGSYYLAEDIYLVGDDTDPNSAWPLIISEGAVTLDLNGHVLDLKKQNINIYSKGKLTLTDSNTENLSHKFRVGDSGLWVLDETQGTKTVAGGVITGGAGVNGGNGTIGILGGGVNVSGGSLAMNGGSIVGCTANNGGGVRVSNGIFTMNGGSIAGCTAVKDGNSYGSGGVRVDESGSFTMEDGSIEGCTAADAGGGVNVAYGSFTMEGGSIVGCTASETGGGVDACGNRFTMEGGSITNCTANYGGGVNLSNNDFTMNGGSIKGCTANNGGGIYVQSNSACILTMTDGSIEGCTAEQAGGGVFVAGGSFTMEDGSITNCTAGGAANAVHADGSFTSTGGSADPVTGSSLSNYGEAANPILIGSAAGLKDFRDRVNGINGKTAEPGLCAKLLCDIVLNDGTFDENGNYTPGADGNSQAEQWTPIGGYDNASGNEVPYTGTFDGNRHTIKGLYVNGADFAGLFGGIGSRNSGATIRDVTVDGYVKGTSVAGGIVGTASNSTTSIQNCVNRCYVVATNNSSGSGSGNAGGIVGAFSDASISGCANTGAVRGTDQVGGIAGWLTYGSISSCYNTGAVSGTNRVGGIAGYPTGGSISSCYNTGAVSGTNDVGGIAGCVSASTVSRCYNTGAVGGTNDVGGGVGRASASTVSSCYNTGTVSGTDQVGGVVGCALASTVSSCYNTGTVSGTDQVGGVAGYVLTDYDANASVSDCYNTGTVEGTNQVGGVAGYVVVDPGANASITSCYYLTGMAVNAVGKNAGGTVISVDARAKTEFAGGTVLELLKQNGTTNAWMGTCGYLKAAGMTLPLLSWQTADAHTCTPENPSQWESDESGHWQVCRCGLFVNKAAHSGTDDGDCTTAVVCECGYEIMAARSGHSWGNWTQDASADTHTRLCQNEGCTESGTGSCADSDNDGKCDACGRVLRSSSGGSSSTPGVADTAAKDIRNAEPGETVRIDMKGETKLPARVLDAAYGKDITLEIDMGNGAVWTINGLDIPKGGASLNLGVRTGVTSIPAKVIDAVSGEISAVQLQLSHDGAFAVRVTLSLVLGKEFDGRFANLYYYNEATGALEFQCSDKIRGGAASWPFAHASAYAVVIDETDHEPMRFADVADGAYYRDAVLWAAKNGVTSGISDTAFGPELPCTRAQIVTFLWRAAGSPVVDYAMRMDDVNEGSYYAEAVRWALSEGITTGTTATTFSPNSECTRAQAVTFLFRYAAPEAVTLQELVSGFADAASVPGYALSAMNWALAAGIVQGDGSKLMPNDSCTRAQIVTFLYRALEK